MEEQQAQQEPQQEAPAQEGVDAQDVEKNKTMAILAYFLFFLPLITDSKDSPFAKFHANQALILLIFAIGGQFIAGALTVIIIGVLLLPIVGVASFVFFILGIVNAANGQMKELPVIGRFHILDK